MVGIFKDQKYAFSDVVDLSQITELRSVEVSVGGLVLGSGLTLTDFKKVSPTLHFRLWSYVCVCACVCGCRACVCCVCVLPC